LTLHSLTHTHTLSRSHAQVEKPPREPSVDPTEVAEKAEKALRAAGGSPAVTGGNLNNTVSKTGRVRKAATVFVAESSFEFNRRREREAKAAEALRKRKRAPPAKFIAEPSHLANQRRGGDDETTVEKTAPATVSSSAHCRDPLTLIRRLLTKPGHRHRLRATATRLGKLRIMWVAKGVP